MKYCELPFEQMHIFPNGDVRVCGWTYQSIGNILENSIEEVWHSKEAEQVRDGIRDGSFCCCNHQTCPYLANDSLVDLSQEEFVQSVKATELPIQFSAAYDFVCNHSCPSCRHEIFVPDEQYLNNMNVITEKLLPVMRNAKAIITDGNGDCFASPSIFGMLRALHIDNLECEISLETNGVLCDEEHLKELEHLYKYNLKLIITPNSFDKNTYQYLSGGHDNLDKLIKNLYYVRKLRRKNIIKNVEISIVVQETNYKELPEFTRKCIEEFECDKVVIKPIFYWFGLTKEEYWFKDILNPNHPYYNEYMRILKDPIFDNEKVFFWGGRGVVHERADHPAVAYQKYLEKFGKLFSNDNPAKILEKKLLDMGYKSIALYGVNDMSEVLYSLLKNTEIPVTCVVDRYANVKTFHGLRVYNADDFDPDLTKCILVSNYVFYKNIEKDLRFWEYKGDIIGYDELI